MTPLYWVSPPSSVVARIYREARSAVPWTGGVQAVDQTLGRQPWLRKVSVEFHRRLREANIFVEGETDVGGEA